MTTSGLVSVIIPAGSIDRWLHIAVDSVLASDYENLELIVVLNGASSGEDPDWARDPRVRVLSFPDRLGPTGANQKGLDVARGEFYAHLDADDVMDSHRLSAQVEHLRENSDVVAVGSRIRWIDETGQLTGAFSNPAGRDVRRALVASNVVPHSALTARMKETVLVGGYDTGMSHMEDYDFLLRIAQHGAISNLDEELGSYRRHSDQFSKTFLPRGHYVTKVLEGRRALADLVGMSRLRLRLVNARWLFEQYGQFVYHRTRATLRQKQAK